MTVSIPFFRCRTTLRRAVESILGQTHRRLTLVVVNDGDHPPWDLLADLDDPRLVRFDLATNRGRYFADAAVLGATDDPYFLVQDADDWSEPHRLATLLRHLRAEHAVGCVSAIRCHHQDSRPGGVERARGLDRPLSAEFEHRVNHHGLFCTAALRAIGGYYGGFRIGYDTLVVNLMQMSGRLAYVEEPLYHRLIRKASLSNSPTSGMGSPARQAAAERLRRIYVDAFHVYSRYLDGGLEHAALCAELSRIARRQVTPADAVTLDDESRRLRAVLAASQQPAKAVAELHRSASIPTLMSAPDPARGGLGISVLTGGRPALLKRTIESLHARNPTLLEESVVVVLINGDDWETRAYVDQLPFVDQCLRHAGSVWPIGIATSRLIRTLVETSRVHTILHLEDDWATETTDAQWLERARQILAAYPDVGQVRLRHSRERVLPNHMVTRRPISWEPHAGFLLARSAHYTFNPSLIRARDASKIFPCKSEREAQVHFLRTRFATAQLLPGVFRHIGEYQSRRTRPDRGLRPSTGSAARDERLIPSWLRTTHLLVSCLMPTGDRRAFVPQAIRYFQRQDYAPRELIVIDDGRDAIADLIPDDPHIRYLRLTEKTTLGAKRNLGCEEARGEVIVHWDDDDWMADGRISYQVASLLKEQADVCGLSRLYFYDLATAKAWEYSCARKDKTWLAGATFCYRKTFWRRNPFPDTSVGEDTRFLWSDRPKKLLPLEDRSFYVAMLHTGNTNSKRTSARGWQAVRPGVLLRLMGEDLVFYQNLGAAEVPATSKANSSPRRKRKSQDHPLVSCIMPTRDRRLTPP